MTTEQIATVAVADHILKAPTAWIDAEPPGCLLEILAVVTDHLFPIHVVGLGWKIIQLEILKGKIETYLQPELGMI